MTGRRGTIPDSLRQHLSSWLGTWPPHARGITVVESDKRTLPEWDGAIRPVRGVADPSGTVISVPPGKGDAVRRLGDDLDTIGPLLPGALGLPGWRFHTGVYRWSDSPTDPGEPGIWVAPDSDGVPEWLRPFNGDVLIGCSNGEVTAGVGRKQHDRWGHELAVVTEEKHRGQGWAVRLVGQAAVRVIQEGATPIYLHGAGNVASARTADASGFPDRGWTIIGISAQQRG